MKLAVTGKGGVGKTTISALLARVARQRGNRVLAIDADPDANLAPTLGHLDPSSIVALTDRKAVIEERVGSGGVIRLNPKVDDLVDTLGVDIDGIRLMVLGTIPKGGGGCFCSPSALLKAFLLHVMTQADEWVILDMEAGLEHLGRGSTTNVDCLLIVVEPYLRSIETAQRIQLLARDLGIHKVWVVPNKTRSDDDIRLIASKLDPLPLLAAVPFSPSLGGFSARIDLASVEPHVMNTIDAIYAAITSS